MKIQNKLLALMLMGSLTAIGEEEKKSVMPLTINAIHKIVAETGFKTPNAATLNAFKESFRNVNFPRSYTFFLESPVIATIINISISQAAKMIRLKKEYQPDPFRYLEHSAWYGHAQGNDITGFVANHVGFRLVDSALGRIIPSIDNIIIPRKKNVPVASHTDEEEKSEEEPKEFTSFSPDAWAFFEDLGVFCINNVRLVSAAAITRLASTAFRNGGSIGIGDAKGFGIDAFRQVLSSFATDVLMNIIPRGNIHIKKIFQNDYAKFLITALFMYASATTANFCMGT